MQHVACCSINSTDPVATPPPPPATRKIIITEMQATTSMAQNEEVMMMTESGPVDHVCITMQMDAAATTRPFQVLCMAPPSPHQPATPPLSAGWLLHRSSTWAPPQWVANASSTTLTLPRPSSVRKAGLQNASRSSRTVAAPTSSSSPCRRAASSSSSRSSGADTRSASISASSCATIGSTGATASTCSASLSPLGDCSFIEEPRNGSRSRCAAASQPATGVHQATSTGLEQLDPQRRQVEDELIVAQLRARSATATRSCHRHRSQAR